MGVENPQIPCVFSTSSNGEMGVPTFPQMENGSKSLVTIGECRFLNILTLSTTTNFFV